MVRLRSAETNIGIREFVVQEMVKKGVYGEGSMWCLRVKRLRPWHHADMGLKGYLWMRFISMRDHSSAPLSRVHYQTHLVYYLLYIKLWNQTSILIEKPQHLARKPRYKWEITNYFPFLSLKFNMLYLITIINYNLLYANTCRKSRSGEINIVSNII